MQPSTDPIPEEPGSNDPVEETFDLVSLAQAGDTHALNRLVERYYPRIRRMVAIRAGGRMKSSTEVDDLVQDVLLRILDGLERFERRSDALFINWVSRLATNEISNQGRRLQHRPGQQGIEDSLIGMLADSTRGVLSQLKHDEEIERVDRCLHELSDDFREILLLREYAGASWSDIHEELDRPSVAACQQLYQRARGALAERLGRGDSEADARA